MNGNARAVGMQAIDDRSAERRAPPVTSATRPAKVGLEEVGSVMALMFAELFFEWQPDDNSRKHSA